MKILIPVFILCLLTVTGCRNQGIAKTQVERQLKDPSSAQYRNLVSYREGVVCGEVNAKNSMGGYVGFRSFIFKKGEASLEVTSEDQDTWCIDDEHTQSAYRKRKLSDLDKLCDAEKSVYGPDPTKPNYFCKEAAETRKRWAKE